MVTIRLLELGANCPPCFFIKTELELNPGSGSKTNWELELDWFFKKKIQFRLWFHFKILNGFIFSPKPFFLFLFLSRSPFFGLATHKTEKRTSWKNKMHFLDLQKNIILLLLLLFSRSPFIDLANLQDKKKWTPFGELTKPKKDSLKKKQSFFGTYKKRIDYYYYYYFQGVYILVL
jgi:hypothetical protein